MSREALFLFALAPIRLEPVNLHTVFVFMELGTYNIGVSIEFFGL